MRTLLAKWWSHLEVRKLNQIIGREAEIQRRLLAHLIARGAQTKFGRDHRLKPGLDYEAFRERVRRYSYETLWERYWQAAWHGEPDQTWPGKPAYFAKTSGTTAGAKFLPITPDSVPTHVRGARLTLAFYIVNTGKPHFVNGRWLFLSGSPALEKTEAGIPYGRLSGIVHHWVPAYLTRNRLPSYAINTIEDWPQKVQAILQEAMPLPLTLLSGIPPWIVQFLETLEAISGKRAREVWPGLQVYVHGGVDFRLYEERLRDFLPGVDFIETFPASEGFFAFQDTMDREEGLRLLVDNGIFYEFILLEEAHLEGARRYPLWEVEMGRKYAMLISTNAGLWAYDLGDVVEFVSVRPYRVRVVGRVKNHLSAFGEHVIEAEVEKAIAAAARASGAQVGEFTVGPRLDPPPCHEWVVAFLTPPANTENFITILDETLQKLNPYYADLRRGSILNRPQVHTISLSQFYAVLSDMGKFGGQNKPPHLKSDRSLLDKLLPFARPLYVSAP